MTYRIYLGSLWKIHERYVSGEGAKGAKENPMNQSEKNFASSRLRVRKINKSELP